MKLKITLGLVLAILAFSCKKDVNGNALTGKWRTTQVFLGLFSSEPLYIQFIWPGKVQSTYFSYCTGYSVEGNNLILKNTGSAVSELNYTYTIKNDTLSLYQADCTGNCNLTFVKE